MKIILFGCPGAGKGTQGKLLENYFDIPHISFGETFRLHVEDKTPIGIKIKDIIEGGNLVPDEITNEIADDLLSYHNNYILDGYPRNFVQADFYKKNYEADFYIFLDVIKTIAEKRLFKRGEEEGRADDMSQVLIDNRFNVYRRDTEKGIHLFENKLYTINGELEINDVFNIIKEIINV